jgi:hypothetical protein
MKQLTEAQAWREIAEQLDTITRESEDGFLCFAIDRLWGLGRITFELRVAMKARVIEQLPPGHGSAYCDTTPYVPAEDRVGRIYAALLFAEMAEEEVVARG